MPRAKNNTRVVGYNTIICPNCNEDNGTFQGSMTELAFACLGCGAVLGVAVVPTYQVELKQAPEKFITAVAIGTTEPGDLGL